MGALDDVKSMGRAELDALKIEVQKREHELIQADLAKRREGAEQHTCPDRQSAPHIAVQVGPTDYWEKRPNGDRTCSYCGSLHPEDYKRLMNEAIKPESEVTIDPSTKGYKIYVGQPGISNAEQGGIKFYTWHAKEHAEELTALHPEAVRVSREKQAARIAAITRLHAG